MPSYHPRRENVCYLKQLLCQCNFRFNFMTANYPLTARRCRARFNFRMDPECKYDDTKGRPNKCHVCHLARVALILALNCSRNMTGRDVGCCKSPFVVTRCAPDQSHSPSTNTLRSMSSYNNLPITVSCKLGDWTGGLAQQFTNGGTLTIKRPLLSAPQTMW